MSPVCGKLIVHISPKFLIAGGIFLEGVACLIFGVLDEVPSGTSYIASAFVVRIVEGIAAAVFMTTSNTLIASEFPDAVASTFSYAETAFSVGLMLGPVIGGALYQVEGFKLPFILCGTLTMSASIPFIFLLPSVVKQNEPISCRDLKAFLLNGRTILFTLGVITSYIIIVFNDSTLEPHLRKFDLSPVLVGLIFMVSVGIYACAAPICGWICDRGTDPFSLMIFGCLVSCAGVSILGPVPFFPFEQKLWIVIISQIVIGLGMSIKCVSTFVGTLKNTLARGYPDNLATYGMISALFISSCSIGSFIGPSIGGFLLDRIGYESGTMVIFAAELFFLFASVIYLVIEWTKKKRNQVEEKIIKLSVIAKTSQI